MGAVTLAVRDLASMRRFYTDVIGLAVVAEDDETVTLGFAERAIVILRSSVAPVPPVGGAGLYHLAILFSTQGELARAVKRLLTHTPELFAGSADHLVSEAFYGQDPEGNGFELYFDRDAAGWEWKDGEVQMDSLYLPPDAYIATHADSRDGESEVRMGHVHLKVGNIEQAHEFYVTILGFALTARMPSALFVSMDSYHHHLGMNTWESMGAAVRSDSLGLSGFEILLHDASSMHALEARLKDAGIAYQHASQGISLEDPWKNRITVRVVASPVQG
jgi:catechol 2,3-dioxygenase